MRLATALVLLCLCSASGCAALWGPTATTTPVNATAPQRPPIEIIVRCPAGYSSAECARPQEVLVNAGGFSVTVDGTYIARH